jgi:hypothetical protein
MKYLSQILLFCFFTINFLNYAQETSKLTITDGEKSFLITTVNLDGTSYFSIGELCEVLGITYNFDKNTEEILIFVDSTKLLFTTGNPFVIKSSGLDTLQKAVQLIHPPIYEYGNVYTGVMETLELLNGLIDRIVVQVSPTKLQIVDRILVDNIDQLSDLKKTITMKIIEEDEKSVVKIISSSNIPVFSNFFSGKNLHLILWNVSVTKDSIIQSSASSFINKIEVIPYKDYTEMIFYLTIDDAIAYYEKSVNEKEISIKINKREYGNWYIRETEHFQCIYRDSHSHLVNHILASAEKSLKVISKLFNYRPSETIVINTYDASDYGYGGTTTIPINFIRLEIEPIEPGYEVIPYNERIQWLISHELVHIAVNDAASDAERFFRNIFGKVNPEKFRPITIPFSLITGKNRYTPRWHQEASAVYLETWLSGGFGRVLGNFDEMYFRSMVVEEKEFPDATYLDGILGHTSFLIETLYYIYGGRFAAHLSIKYGNDKLFKWFGTEKSDFLSSYKVKFNDIFGMSFNEAWKNFITDETAFQLKNLKTLRTSSLSTSRVLSNETYGFVTEPYYSKKMNSIIFGYHRSDELATLRIFDFNNFTNKELVSLQTPSAIGVASTAYDDSLGLIFYTTNNNQLYRDIRLYDIQNNKDNLLFKDCRTGHLTISSKKHELWGIQHNSGNAILVRSKYPFDLLETIVVFEIGDEIQQLSINNSGDLLAAVIHRSSGQQSIVIADLTKLDEGGKFLFNTITYTGSPENPSWSEDDRYLFWNAYTNGVSNIYRIDLETGRINAVTHNLTGLFKPIFISKDSLFAFKFTTNGMAPVIIPNSEPEKLPAINYLGQQILVNNPEVMDWIVSDSTLKSDELIINSEKEFNSISYLNFQTFIPMISGFQNSKVLGFYTQLADPILRNEISLEVGVSPFKEILNKIRYHIKFKYNIKQTFYFAVEHNPPDFYDLFNERKRGTLGNRFAIGHNDYWLFDNPLKIKQTTEFSYYSNTRFINDNLVEVSEPDFYVLRTEFEYKKLRRSIGSFDFEKGNHFLFHIIGFGAEMEKFEIAPGTYFEWDHYLPYLFPHNTLKLKIAAGYHYFNKNIIQAQFFFGGFGNRGVENEPVRQYEKVFRFPGIPIYSVPTDNFLKLMFSNVFPPLRFNLPEIFEHSIKNINFSVFSQGLITNLPETKKWIDAGAQLNIMFSHWYNLESTLSAGIAKAWWKGGNDWEWFVSYKLLRD